MKYILDEKFLLEEDGADDPADLTAEETTAEGSGDVADTATSADINFEVEFKNAKTTTQLEQVWQKFYTKTFGADAEVVRKRFHTALAVYVPKLGWTTTENPILGWLSQSLKNNKTKPLITSEGGYSYSYIMTLEKALTNKWLSPAELVGLGGVEESVEFGAYDIALHPSFPTMSSNTQLEWLKFRDTVRRDFKNVVQRIVVFAYSSLLQANAGAFKTKIDEEGRDTGILGLKDESLKSLLRTVTAKGVLVDLPKAKTRFTLFTGKDLAAKPIAEGEFFTKLLATLTNVEQVKQTFAVAYDALSVVVEGWGKSLPANEKKALDAYRNTITGVNGAQFRAAKKLLKLGQLTYREKEAGDLLYAIAAKDPAAKMPERVKAAGAT